MNIEVQTKVISAHVEDGVIILDEVEIECLYEVSEVPE